MPEDNKKVQNDIQNALEGIPNDNDEIAPEAPGKVGLLKMSVGGLMDSNVLDLFLIKGKNVVATGAARGFSLNFAQALAQAGANIAAIDVAERQHTLGSTPFTQRSVYREKGHS
ncbi:hypothetical protein CLAIMM_03482 [Cladophialophora immunda]|nr:hypothetical protein CLAIMM_03482 [Cladophialophora immunda]